MNTTSCSILIKTLTQFLTRINSLITSENDTFRKIRIANEPYQKGKFYQFLNLILHAFS